MKKKKGVIKVKWEMINYPVWIQKYNEVVYRTKTLLMEQDALLKAVQDLEACRPQMKMEYVN